MIRFHGKAPYRVVTVHGGPGAIGALKDFSDSLSAAIGCGVAEALQSRYSIDALIGELHEQLDCLEESEIVLIGHSWGALLAALTAARYPDRIRELVLIGCPPLLEKYVPEIGEQRMRNLSGEDRDILERVMLQQATDSDLGEISRVLKQSDNYCLIEDGSAPSLQLDSRMHNLVWKEAQELRKSGKLLSAFQTLKCKIHIVHGVFDPHPHKGIIEPLQEKGIQFQYTLLEKCGHSPFRERYAKVALANQLKQIV